LPIALYISDIEFGPEDKAQEIMNGWYCKISNKLCDTEEKGMEVKIGDKWVDLSEDIMDYIIRMEEIEQIEARIWRRGERSFIDHHGWLALELRCLPG
jgi:hypothetical protein